MIKLNNMKNYLALLFVILNLSNASSATTILANDYNNIIVKGIIKNDYKVVSIYYLKD